MKLVSITRYICMGYISSDYTLLYSKYNIYKPPNILYLIKSRKSN